MAPPHANDSEIFYNAKLISEELSKADIGNVEIPTKFLGEPTERYSLPYDSWADVPQLDFTEAEKDEAGLAKKLVDAVTDWGFFTFMNHGISQELIEEIQAEGHKFFNLPFEVKQKVGLTGLYHGYNGDYQAFKLERMLWNEGMMMDMQTTQPEDFASKIWPDGGHTFSATVRKYCEAVRKVQILILQLMAVGLGLERDFFAKHFAPGIPFRDLFRWNYYPPCPKPQDVMGAMPHSDIQMMAILHDGELGGLQVERNGEWRGIKPVKGALVFNAGEFLKIWTNDRLKSPIHRVVVNETKPRLSTVIFLNAGDDTVLSAPSSLVEDIGEERKYKDFALSEYYKFVMEDKAAGKVLRSKEIIAVEFQINSGERAEAITTW